MKHGIYYLLTATLLLIVTPLDSLACRNAIQHPTLEDHSIEATTILTAQVESVQKRESFNYSISLKPLHWWKGRLENSLRVEGTFHTCAQNRQAPRASQTIIAFISRAGKRQVLTYYLVESDSRLKGELRPSQADNISKILGAGVSHFVKQEAPFTGDHLPAVYAAEQERHCLRDRECRALPGVCNATVLAVNEVSEQLLRMRVNTRQIATSCVMQKDRSAFYKTVCVKQRCSLQKKS